MHRTAAFALALVACSASPPPPEPAAAPTAAPVCACGGVIEVELSSMTPQTTWRLDPPARIVQWIQGQTPMGGRGTYPITVETISQDGRLIYTSQPTSFLHVRYLW